MTGEREVVGAREGVRASGIGNGYRHEDDVRDLRDVGIELAADGTGGGRVAGFAWCTTYLEEGEREEGDTAGTGWVPGEPGSDRAELGALLQQIREVEAWREYERAQGRQPRWARLVSDCEGALRAAEWAISAQLGKVLRHKNRALLLEWRYRFARCDGEVTLAWLPSHTDRTDWPFPAHTWCDETAPLAVPQEPEEAERVASAHDAPFLLWDSTAYQPVCGSWGEAISQRTGVQLAAQARRPETS